MAFHTIAWRRVIDTIRERPYPLLREMLNPIQGYGGSSSTVASMV